MYMKPFILLNYPDYLEQRITWPSTLPRLHEQTIGCFSRQRCDKKKSSSIFYIPVAIACYSNDFSCGNIYENVAQCVNKKNIYVYSSYRPY